MGPHPAVLRVHPLIFSSEITPGMLGAPYGMPGITSPCCPSWGFRQDLSKGLSWPSGCVYLCTQSPCLLPLPHLCPSLAGSPPHNSQPGRATPLSSFLVSHIGAQVKILEVGLPIPTSVSVLSQVPSRMGLYMGLPCASSLSLSIPVSPLSRLCLRLDPRVSLLSLTLPPPCPPPTFSPAPLPILDGVLPLGGGNRGGLFFCQGEGGAAPHLAQALRPPPLPERPAFKSKPALI